MDEVKLLPWDEARRIVSNWLNRDGRLAPEYYDSLSANYEVRQAIETLLTRPTLVTGQLEGEGWQPIETAPKDGTIIDVWGSCKDDDARWTGRFPNVEWTTLAGGGEDWLWDGLGISSPSIDAKLTHWRPLPEPPPQPGPSQ